MRGRVQLVLGVGMRGEEQLVCLGERGQSLYARAATGSHASSARMPKPRHVRPQFESGALPRDPELLRTLLEQARRDPELVTRLVTQVGRPDAMALCDATIARDVTRP